MFFTREKSSSSISDAHADRAISVRPKIDGRSDNHRNFALKAYFSKPRARYQVPLYDLTFMLAIDEALPCIDAVLSCRQAFVRVSLL